MPPTLALILWLICLLALLCFDPAKDSRASGALWVPLIWMFFAGSRNPAQWLAESVGTTARAFEEGNLEDRIVFSVLIVLAMAILISRSFKWGDFFARNKALVAFISFALLSVLWSDFPFVSFKRWFRDLGSYLMILVVLSDPYPLEAVRTLLRRLCYLLIPLSILLFKYYPSLGRQFNVWSGATMFVGATTSKNMLGLLCLVSAIFFFWDTAMRWAERKEQRTKRIILLNIAFIAMTLWLLYLADSATSRVCLVIGCVIIIVSRSRWAKRRPGFFATLIPTIFCLYLILAYGLDMNGALASAVGRNATLTDRTAIWSLLLGLHTNPLVGTGYESFWLGARLQSVWKVFHGINESHNGYLEVYLNMGLIGLGFLVVFLIAAYRTIWKGIRSSSALASLSLAIWTILLFYNVTEAAFGAGLLWLILMPGGLVLSAFAGHPVRSVADRQNSGTTPRFPKFPLAPPHLQR